MMRHVGFRSSLLNIRENKSHKHRCCSCQEFEGIRPVQTFKGVARQDHLGLLSAVNSFV